MIWIETKRMTTGMNVKICLGDSNLVVPGRQSLTERTNPVSDGKASIRFGFDFEIDQWLIHRNDRLNYHPAAEEPSCTLMYTGLFLAISHVLSQI
jgi:nucleoside diphosphate kinase